MYKYNNPLIVAGFTLPVVLSPTGAFIIDGEKVHFYLPIN
jgi:hypothetical protein